MNSKEGEFLGRTSDELQPFLGLGKNYYHNLGKGYRISYDLEDIIYLIDNRTTIVEEMIT